MMTMTNSKPLPPLSLLREFFLIDESSPSGLRWRVKRTRSAVPGSVAGSTNNSTGYWFVGVNSRIYLVHRIIYFIHHGTDPVGSVIDHADRDRTNNKIENLRMVDCSHNSRNTGLDPRNVTGCTGVCIHKSTGKYYAYIRAYRKYKHLGNFDNLEDAIAARKAAEVRLWG